MNGFLIPDPFESSDLASRTSAPQTIQGEYTGKMRRIAWLIVAFAFGRLIISTFFGPMSDYPAMHFQLTAPYIFFAVAIVLIRTERMARWACGVALLLAIVTWATEYEAEHHFWPYLNFWVTHISLGQSVISIFFLFESVRQYLRFRRVPGAQFGGSLATAGGAR
jgi:hypothetical protein